MSSRQRSQMPQATWDELRAEARKLEQKVDTQLVAFSKLGKDYTRSSGVSDPLLPDQDGLFESMALELQQLLIKLTAVNDNMQKVVGDNPSPTVAHGLSRHTNRLNDMQHEFSKTKHSIRDTLNKSELLSTNKQMNSYRSGEGRREDLLMKEGHHIANTNRHLEETIEMGLKAKEALAHQQGILGRASNKLNVITQNVPGLNNIIGKIQYRKHRDRYILAGVTATCIFFIIWYVIH
eukprot:m.77349 g.77349  ORF g.77349 m.77349 type:complete len:236 (-) comp12619_c0_seq1:2728-3435(-)